MSSVGVAVAKPEQSIITVKLSPSSLEIAAVTILKYAPENAVPYCDVDKSNCIAIVKAPLSLLSILMKYFSSVNCSYPPKVSGCLTSSLNF